MSEIWLIRHGPTHARTLVGWSDLPADLSDHAAIARLEQALPDAPVVSSDLCRAHDTADAIQGPRPRLPDMAALREMHFGAWENKTWAEVEADDPKRAFTLFDAPGAIAPPGGESWDALTGRIVPTLTELAAQHDHLIVVAHFGVILAALAHAGGWSAKHAYSHKIDPLSLSQIRLGADLDVVAINQIL